jgi:hypothetical protein
MIEIKGSGNKVELALKGSGNKVVGEIGQGAAGIKKICVEQNILVDAAVRDPDELMREDGQTNDD